MGASAGEQVNLMAPEAGPFGALRLLRPGSPLPLLSFCSDWEGCHKYKINFKIKVKGVGQSLPLRQAQGKVKRRRTSASAAFTSRGGT
jgi:hypothetical protein